MNREELFQLVEEISLLVAMLHEKDEAGFALILEQVQQLESACQGAEQYARLSAACSAIIKAAPGVERHTLRDSLSAFATAAQEFLRDGNSGVFPFEEASGAAGHDSSWEHDLSKEADQELIVEFISQHLLAMDEFESQVVELIRLLQEERSPGADCLKSAIKGYLHSLKGEAATVGLIGIAETVHFLEDVLSAGFAGPALESLLAFREWFIQVIKAYSAGAQLPESASAFRQRIETPVQEKPLEETAEAGGRGPAAGSYAISGEFEVLGEFLAEAEDHLGAVEETLLEAKGNWEAEHIASFFRAIHSVKGGSSYFDLKEVTQTSHCTETLLDKARSGEIAFTAAVAELLLEYIDLQKELFARVRKGVANGGIVEECARTPGFLERVQRLLHGSPPPPPKEEAAPVEQTLKEEAESPAGGKTERDKPAEASKAAIKTFLKVEAGRLDQLIDYIGEMVISSSMVLRDCRMLLSENDAVMKNAHRFEQIVREVQYLAMTMRLVPIKGTFQKMSRLVWDLSKRTGKKIRFEMEGEDTELDRTVIEQIADPLMHMVRNAVDHGIEPADKRTAKGKNVEGLVRLKAFHQGGIVHIQIVDDGAGLDPERILRKAIEKGLVPREQSLRKDEILQLIFASGFSTAEKVTDISGRGVGMDVVRRNIEKLRGRVSIESELGAGTTFTVKLPLTLAIIEGIETSVGREHFIIPTLSVVEFLKPAENSIHECMQKAEVLEFRGRYLPVFHLSRLYDVPGAIESARDGIVVIVEAAGEHVGIAVDAVLGSQAVVIKSLGGLYSAAGGIAGGAIMPDGNVGLILDIPGLISFARERYGSRAMTESAVQA